MKEGLSHPCDHRISMAFADAGADPSEVARLRAEVARLQGEVHAQQEKAKGFFERLEGVQAELEEYRSQVQRDMEELRWASKGELIVKVLDVTDSLDRAIEFAGGDEALHDALVNILRQTRAILEREGVKRIESEGHPYRPAFHEAVMREVTGEYRDGAVIKELAKGYTLRGKVLRRAKVKVAQRPEAP